MTWKEYAEQAFLIASPIYAVQRTTGTPDTQLFPVPMLTALAGLVSELAELQHEHNRPSFSLPLCASEAGDCFWYAMLLLRLLDGNPAVLLENFGLLLTDAQHRIHAGIPALADNAMVYIEYAQGYAARLASLLKKHIERGCTVMLPGAAYTFLERLMDVIACLVAYVVKLPHDPEQDVLELVLQGNLHKLRMRHGAAFNGKNITMR